ncbi:hypothetical protein RBU49_01850 [Clostridium sp. MB40-C1]|uniref:hypothetical protein n=1 Tax=Clostridium sp. MB40-C1 TaxID=3070996 RepID=UPI0027E15662|nr:hypothetical protein [Clostridium sp. MB40-C1]WMJ81022.1 hypothetical protein RBU49_01850 [Clostridium sp. MB40-C1]
MNNKVIYLMLGIIIFLAVDFISINFGLWIGTGPCETGIVTSAISILCSTIVICTCIIVDEIRKFNK